jgi:short-subunit dehydrogenase involved in D-alanine esterification of teichoic acids
MDIQNQTILITGGTSGIGKALALSLKEKNTVIVTGRSIEAIRRSSKKGAHPDPGRSDQSGRP